MSAAPQRITDAQVHVWELSRPDRPWPSGRFVPEWASSPTSAEQVIAQMDEAGVDRAILVPPAFEGDRNDLSLDAAKRYPDRFAVMGRLPLDDPTTFDRMSTWLEEPGALGLRFTFFIPQQRAWLRDGTSERLWSHAEELQIPLMVLPLPDDVGLFAEIAESHPDLRLIIDHLAVGPEVWRRDDRAFEHLPALNALARYENVAVKASGLPEYSTAGYPFANLHPHIRSVTDAFGAARVFWGTDLTRLPCTYREAITMFTEEMDWLDNDALRWIMGRGISRWLGWADPEDDQ